MSYAPIASLGFWASNDVPISAGKSSLKQSANLSHSKPAATSLAAVVLPSLPLDKELEVRENLAAASELAEVGTNIRWDLILEEASKMSCGLKTSGIKNNFKKAASTRSADEDLRSTSASGSGGDLEAGSNSDLEDEGQREANVSLAQMPPWRRSPVSKPDLVCSGQRETGARVPPPWRRRTASTDSCQTYSIATMLNYWFLMDQASNAIVETKAAEDDYPDVLEQKCKAPPPSSASGAARDRSSQMDAPWRRRINHVADESLR